jgi:hypothetical protein
MQSTWEMWPLPGRDNCPLSERVRSTATELQETTISGLSARPQVVVSVEKMPENAAEGVRFRA